MSWCKQKGINIYSSSIINYKKSSSSNSRDAKNPTMLKVGGNLANDKPVSQAVLPLTNKRKLKIIYKTSFFHIPNKKLKSYIKTSRP